MTDESPKRPHIIFRITGNIALLTLALVGIEKGIAINSLQPGGWLLSMLFAYLFIMLSFPALLVGLLPTVGLGMAFTSIIFTFSSLPSILGIREAFLLVAIISACLSSLACLKSKTMILGAARGSIAGFLYSGCVHSVTVSLYGLDQSLFYFMPFLVLLSILIWTISGVLVSAKSLFD